MSALCQKQTKSRRFVCEWFQIGADTEFVRSPECLVNLRSDASRLQRRRRSEFGKKGVRINDSGLKSVSHRVLFNSSTSSGCPAPWRRGRKRRSDARCIESPAARSSLGSPEQHS